MLKGKVAFVTGGSSGIGRAIAVKMAENGADVAIIYVGDHALAEETCALVRAQGVRALAYECDVASFAQTKEVIGKVIAEWGGIDILVNNAGITRDNLLVNMKEADFDLVLDINLKGAFNTIKHCYMHFLKKRSGKIINISSVAGINGNVGQANYSASKSGLIGLTKTVARELAGRNVNCNAIAPGFIATELTADLPGQEEIRERIAFKRMGTPDDVAELALFLASEKANYITGEVIRVDGGLVI